MIGGSAAHLGVGVTCSLSLGGGVGFGDLSFFATCGGFGDGSSFGPTSGFDTLRSGGTGGLFGHEKRTIGIEAGVCGS